MEYKEKLEEAKRLYESATADQRYILESLFPEIRESEDEKIRREIINYFNCQSRDEPSRKDTHNKWIAWLEKQKDINALIQEASEKAYTEGMRVERKHWLEKQAGVVSDKDDIEAEEKGIRKAFNKIWEEKQGEQKPIIEMKSPEESLGISSKEYNDIVNDCLYGEEKPTEKVEPKFHNGEWITNGDYTWKIIDVKPLDYILQSQDGNIVDDTISHVDEQFNLWTIQDAKDGDVLAFYREYKGNKMVQVGIVKEYVGKHGGCSNTFSIYVGVNWESNLQIGKYMGCPDIQPATKEQCDTLERAMTNAGYAFDFEKKKLKKIEKCEDKLFQYIIEERNKPYFYYNGKEASWNDMPYIVRKHDYPHHFVGDLDCFPFSQVQNKPTKNQKSVWSEEDVFKVQRICKYLNEAKYYTDITEVRDCMEWLKSLEQRIGG